MLPPTEKVPSPNDAAAANRWACLAADKTVMSERTTSSTERAPPYRGAIDAKDEDLILVLDFGSQTAQLITRRVREQNVFCQLARHDLSAERIRELNPKGLILSGGPASVYGENAPQPDPEIFELGIPILGICYGMGLACRSKGSQVSAGTSREFGRTSCRVLESDGLFAG